MPTVSLSPNARLQFISAAGVPIVGAKLYTYLAGTSTPEATFTDYTGATPNANPVIADARGEVVVWLDRAKAYKFTLRDASDNLIWTEDQINYAGASGFSQTFAAGTAANPSVNFVGATTSGLYSPGSNQVGISTNGASAVQIDASQNVGMGGAPSTRLDVYGTGKFRGALTVTTGGVIIQASGLVISAGGATITGATAITGNTSVAGGTFASRGFADNATAAAWSLDTTGRLVNNGATQPRFNAQRATSQQTSGTVLIFNSEAYDIGSVYNSATGVFTAPVAGEYAFSTSAEFTNATGATVAQTLFLSGSSVGVFAASSAYILTANSIVLACSSASIVLGAGETVSAGSTSALSASFVMTVNASNRFAGRLMG